MAWQLLGKIARIVTAINLAGILSVGTYHSMSRYQTTPSYAIPIHSPLVQEDTVAIDEMLDYASLTPAQVLSRISTPAQSQHYLETYLQYDHQEAYGTGGPIMIIQPVVESFARNHEKASGTCFDYAAIPAAHLYDDGYPPLLLAMRAPGAYHMLFLYRIQSGFGALGTEAMEPAYPAVNDLVKAYNEQYETDYRVFAVADLDHNFGKGTWVDTPGNYFMYYLDIWETVQ
jgi:hypothetical protein